MSTYRIKDSAGDWHTVQGARLCDSGDGTVSVWQETKQGEYLVAIFSHPICVLLLCDQKGA